MANKIDNRLSDRGDNFGGAKQAGLDRGNGKIVRQYLDLFANERGIERFNARDFAGNLSDDAADGVEAVNAKRAKRF